MITNKLVSLVRRNRTPHQIPAPLIALDQALNRVTADEQQEAATLEQARQILLNDPNAGPTHTTHAKPQRQAAKPRHRSAAWLPPLLTVGAGALLVAGMSTLLLWTLPPVQAIASTFAIIATLPGLILPLFRIYTQAENDDRPIILRVLKSWLTITRCRTHTEYEVNRRDRTPS